MTAGGMSLLMLKLASVRNVLIIAHLGAELAVDLDSNWSRGSTAVCVHRRAGLVPLDQHAVRSSPANSYVACEMYFILLPRDWPKSNS